MKRLYLIKIICSQFYGFKYSSGNTPWCSSYRKGSLRVTLDYGRQLYLLYLLIYFLVIILI